MLGHILNTLSISPACALLFVDSNVTDGIPGSSVYFKYPKYKCKKNNRAYLTKAPKLLYDVTRLTCPRNYNGEEDDEDVMETHLSQE